MNVRSSFDSVVHYASNSTQDDDIAEKFAEPKCAFKAKCTIRLYIL